MVTTNDEKLAERMNQMRNHGASISEEQRHQGPKPYILPDVNLLGYNYRMTDVQGAIGMIQLTKLDGFITERAKWAGFYIEKLADIEWISLPVEPENGSHGWQSFVVYCDPVKGPAPRNKIMEQLQNRGISTRPGTHAVHMLGLYKEKFDINAKDFPISQDCNNNTMAIPLHNRMTEEDYEYIVETLHEL